MILPCLLSKIERQAEIAIIKSIPVLNSDYCMNNNFVFLLHEEQRLHGSMETH